MKWKLYIVSLLLIIGQGAYAQIDESFFLIARNLGEKGLANMDTIRVFGFATGLGVHPNIPGPTLEMNQGDSVEIDLWNVSQGAPHTIHLHGLDVDQQNDGVPHLSFEIHHMDHGYYYFKAPHAGTYLYHCHVASTVHVQAGMYGLLIVHPTDGSNTTWDGGHAFNKELSWLMSEIDTTWHTDSVMDHDHDTTLSVHNVTIPKYDPQFFLVNGSSDQQLAENNIELSGKVGEKVYLRLANIGYCGNRVILPAGLNAEIVASDGRPLPIAEESDTIVLFPGERYGVLVVAQTEFIDSVTVEYISMNTMATKGLQYIPVHIQGFMGMANLESPSFSVAVAPNPFTSQTMISIELVKPAELSLNLTNINGQQISGFYGGEFAAGVHSLPVNEGNLNAGLYVLRVISDRGEQVVKKLVVQ